MGNSPVTLDFSKAQPVDQGVALDFSKAQPVDNTTRVPSPTQTDVLGRPALVAPPTPKPQGDTISATPRGVMTVPFARALMNAVDKLRDAQNFTQEGKVEHPVQAKLGDLANQIEGFLFGNETHGEAAIGSGKTGVLTNPVTSGLLPGPEGVPAAASAIEGGVNAVKSGAQAIKSAVTGGGEATDAVNAATHVYNPKTGTIDKIKQAISPEAASQPGAQTALRSGAASSAEDAATTAGLKNVRVKPSNAGVRTLLDEPIAALAKNEGATYDAINEASGTDLKSLYDHAEEVQDALDDPTNIGQKTALQAELKTTQDQIAQGEAQAAKNGVSPATLDKAKAQTQQRYSMQDARKKIFDNENIVEGNLAHGGNEIINVKAAIKAIENLDKESKFAPPGTPTRLVQAFGKDGAAKLKQGLYDAKAAGKTVMDRNKILGILGVGSGSAVGILHEIFK